MATPTDAAVLRALLKRLRAHLRWILPSVLFAVGVVLANTKAVLLPKVLFDRALAERDFSIVLSTSLLLVALFVAYGLCDFFHRLFLRVAVERTVRDLRKDLFDKILVLSHDRSLDFTSGKAVTHIVSDIHIMSFGIHILADVIKEPLLLIALLTALFSLNWKLTLICAVALPLVSVLAKGFGRSARRNQGRIQSSLSDMSNHVLETLGGLKTAHAYGRVGELRKEFADKANDGYRFLIRLARTEELISPMTKLFAAGVGALLMAAGGLFVVRGEMTAGDIGAFILAAASLQHPIRQLNHVNVRLQQVLAAAHRVFALLETPLDSVGEAQARALESSKARKAGARPPSSPVEVPSLRFDAVTYRYPTRGPSDRPFALEQLSFGLDPGKKLALVGRSGSGKSTTCLLALRFIDPSSGRVLLSGKAATDWELTSYRNHFAWVSQDIFLFNKNIRENLLFAAEGASDAEIWQALERAHLSEFVSSLPQGLDTELGERASQISGGEKQRLAIARAFLKNAPLVLLDEATSQLDAHSERAVTSALQELMRDRSALIIAHRLSTIRNADRVLVLEQGRLEEEGTPGELLERQDGLFRNFWETSRT